MYNPQGSFVGLSMSKLRYLAKIINKNMGYKMKWYSKVVRISSCVEMKLTLLLIVLVIVKGTKSLVIVSFDKNHQKNNAKLLIRTDIFTIAVE